MSYFDKWTKKIKIAFVIRVLTLICTIGILVGIIASNGHIVLLLAGGSFIASIIILILLIILEAFALYKFIERINKYYSNFDRLQEASKDPEILKDFREIREIVETLDFETMQIVRSLKKKEDVPKEEVSEALNKTEKTLKVVEGFKLKYPDLNPTGIREPKILIAIYNKRISLLRETLI